MVKIKYMLLAGFLSTFTVLLRTCHCQQSTFYNQSPYQQQQPFQRQQLRQSQSQQQRKLFPFAPNTLSSLNTIQPASSILPQNIYSNTYNQRNSQYFVPITSYQNDLNYDGSFSYGYTAGDGTTAHAQGYVKNLGLGEADEIQVVQGSYSYISPEGTPITVRYIADENGFRAEGAHIPMPQSIATKFQNSYQQNYSPNINPYQAPFGPFRNNLKMDQISPLQLQQQQRFLQQVQNSAQYTMQNQFGYSPSSSIAGGTPFDHGATNQFGNHLQGHTNFSPQQQNLTQHQQQNRQQQINNQQQEQNQNEHQQVSQELRARSNQLINPYGYNPYRRYKKSTI